MKIPYYRDLDWNADVVWKKLNPTGKRKILSGGPNVGWPDSAHREYIQHRHHIFFKRWIPVRDVEYFDEAIVEIKNDVPDGIRENYTITIASIDKTFMDNCRSSAYINMTMDYETWELISQESQKKNLTVDQYLAIMVGQTADNKIENALLSVIFTPPTKE